MVSKLLNNFKTLLIIIVFSMVVNIIFANNSEAACKKNADGAILLEANSSFDSKPFALAGTSAYDQDSCNEEPLYYKVKFYRVALCTADPYTTANGTFNNTAGPDFSSCIDVFNDEKELEIEPNQPVDLIDTDIILPLGSYKYAIVLVSNHISVKHYHEIVLANGNAATIYGYHASSDATGTVCYSGYKSGTTEFLTTYNNELQAGAVTTLHGLTLPTVDAGTSAGAKWKCGSSSDATSGLAYAIEIIDHLGDDRYLTDNENFRNFNAYGTITTSLPMSMAANMMQDNGLDLGTTIENSTRILGIYNYDNPVVITEDTSSMELQINTSEGISLDFSVNTITDRIYAAKVGADPFFLRFVTGGRLD